MLSVFSSGVRVIEVDDRDDEEQHRPSDISYYNPVYIYQNGSSIAFVSASVTDANTWTSGAIQIRDDEGQGDDDSWSAKLYNNRIISGTCIYHRIIAVKVIYAVIICSADNSGVRTDIPNIVITRAAVY